MNRSDTLRLRGFLARFINDQAMRYGDMPEATRADQRRKAAFGKEIDEATKLYTQLDPGPYKAPKVPKEIVVGACPCGRDVRIGERYAISTEGTTTITRHCACGRANDVDLSVMRRVQPVDWTIRSCVCGEPIRVRSDYAGAGFPEYQGRMDLTGATRKNRTVRVKCRCGCRWSFQIRFEKIAGGKVQRSLPHTVVERCQRCAKVEVPGMTPVEPKRKRAPATTSNV